MFIIRKPVSHSYVPNSRLHVTSRSPVWPINTPPDVFSSKHAVNLKYEGIHLQVLTVTVLLYNILMQYQNQT